MESGKVIDATFCILGDSGVGKSSILQRLTDSSFRDKHLPTVGVDFDSTILELDHNLFRLNIYDVSGDVTFLGAAQAQIKHADAFVFVYDVTNGDSFTHAQRWHSVVNGQAKARNLPKLLLGNMSDLQHKRAVEGYRAQEYAVPENMRHVEVSAKTGKNVNAAFFILANLILIYRRLGGHQRVALLPTDPSYKLMRVQDPPVIKPSPDVEDYTHVFRILLIGSQRTGKSAIRLRYTRDYFSTDYYASAGFEYSTRTLMVDGERVKIQVWDVSGDPLYDGTRRGYFKGANAFVILYDVTSQDSYTHAQQLLKELDLYEQSQCPKILVGNKMDKGCARREVKLQTATEFAQGWRIPNIEVSAKVGTNVEDVFLKLVTALMDQCSPWKQVYNFS